MHKRYWYCKNVCFAIRQYIYALYGDFCIFNQILVLNTKYYKALPASQPLPNTSLYLSCYLWLIYYLYIRIVSNLQFAYQPMVCAYRYHWNIEFLLITARLSSPAFFPVPLRLAAKLKYFFFMIVCGMHRIIIYNFNKRRALLTSISLYFSCIYTYIVYLYAYILDVFLIKVTSLFPGSPHIRNTDQSRVYNLIVYTDFWN